MRYANHLAHAEDLPGGKVQNVGSSTAPITALDQPPLLETMSAAARIDSQKYGRFCGEKEFHEPPDAELLSAAVRLLN